MKDLTMSKTHDNPTGAEHTYLANLTIHTEPRDFRDMREWLAEYAQPVPQRDDHVLAKFIRSTLLSNAEWDGVYIDINVSRCRPAGAPWEADPVHDGSSRNEVRLLAKLLCLAATLLACMTLAYEFRHSLDCVGARLHTQPMVDNAVGHPNTATAA
jgi:hypothetical protein